MSPETTATTSTGKALHWVGTGLTAVVLAAIGAPNVMQAATVMESYRPYLATILGVWNLPRRRATPAGRAAYGAMRRPARGGERSRQESVIYTPNLTKVG